MKNVINNKKILAIIIAIVLLMFVSACGVRYSTLPGSELEPPSIEPNTISAGNVFSMAIKEDGSLWAWGSNHRGQLGDGTRRNRHSPVMIRGDMASVSTNVGEFIYSSVGGTLVAGLTADGTLVTWGVDIRDRALERQRSVGNPPQTSRFLSTPVEIMKNVSGFSVGNGHIMAITSDGTLWGWGVNSHRQIVTSESRHYPSPTPVKNDVIAVSVGSFHTMAITSDNVLWGWGSNSSGQIGDGTVPHGRATPPTRIKDDVIAVSAGNFHTMAITSDGALWGWGGNRRSPEKIMDDVIAVSSGAWHSMAIRSDGSLWALGANWGSPEKIMDDVVAVSVGADHTIAVTSDGVLWAWGSNDVGQLGDGTTENRNSPVRIMENVKLP